MTNENEKIRRTELNGEELTKVNGGEGPTPDHIPVSSSAVVGRAQAELGKPYAWSGVGPDNYDASGLVSYCLTGVHMRIGVESTFMGWPRVSNPAPGDVCVSNSHCGIYVKPGQMIHAPTFGQAVCYGPIQSDMIIVGCPR